MKQYVFAMTWILLAIIQVSYAETYRCSRDVRYSHVVKAGPKVSSGMARNNYVIDVPSGMRAVAVVDLTSGGRHYCDEGNFLVDGSVINRKTYDLTSSQTIVVSATAASPWVLSADTPIIGYGPYGAPIYGSPIYKYYTTYYTEYNYTVDVTFKSTRFNVTFKSNGGAGDDFTQEFRESQGQSLKANPFKRSGYMFRGWSESSSSTTASYRDGEYVSFSGATTLYAVWEKIYGDGDRAKAPVTLTMDANGGSLSPGSRLYYPGSAYGDIPKPTRESHYKFKGWYTGKTDGSSVKSTDRISKATTIYARWERVKFDITFDPCGGSVSPTVRTYDKGKAYGDTFPTPTRIGYSFSGWYTAASGGVKIATTDTCTKDRTLYAQWKGKKYTIALFDNGGSGGKASVKVTYAAAMPTMTTLPVRTGYAFDGYWTARMGGIQYVDEAGRSVRNWMVADSEVQLYAHWIAKRYTVRLNANGGTSTRSQEEMRYGEAGFSNGFTRPVREGYKFLGYFSDPNGGAQYYDANGSPVSKYEVAGTSTLYARWAKLVTVTYHPNWVPGYPEFGSLVQPVEETFAEGEPYGYLRSASRTGYVFEGWFTESEGGTRVQNGMVVTGDRRDLYAQWSLLPESSFVEVPSEGKVVGVNVHHDDSHNSYIDFSVCSWIKYESLLVGSSVLGGSSSGICRAGWSGDGQFTLTVYANAGGIREVVVPVRSGTTSSGPVEAYIVVRQLGDGTGRTPVFSADSPVRGLFARSTTASVDLAWDAASGATAYLVFRADSGLSNFTQIGQSTSAAYRDASAVPGRVHSYFVEPVNALGRDGRSAVTDGYRALSAPVLWAPTASSSGVSLSWKPVTGASHYRVFRESEIDSGRVALGTGWQKETSFTDITCALGKESVYYVQAACSSAGLRAGEISAPMRTSRSGTGDLSARANLAFVAASGWPSAVYFSTSKGSKEAKTEFYSGDEVYLNVAFVNDGKKNAPAYKIKHEFLDSAGNAVFGPSVTSCPDGQKAGTILCYADWDWSAILYHGTGTFTYRGTLDCENDVDENKSDNVYTCQISVRPGIRPPVYKLTVKPNSTKYGSASGSGTYETGKLVQLKATAKSGYVFTGWFTDADCTKKLNPEGYDNRKPTIKITMPAKAMTIYAKFNSVATDKSGLKFSDSTAKLAKTAKAYAANAKISLALGFSSKSYPKVTASGLPEGLSIDAITGKITGTVKKPGAYTAKVTVTSAAGNKITQDVKIDVKAPSWATGTFSGYGAVIVKGKTVPVSATFTATEVGKVSGKVIYKGRSASFTANYASATDTESRFTVSFSADGVKFKSAMSIKEKTSGLTYTRAHALKADSFELELQKVVPLAQKGKSLEKMIGNSYTFKQGYEGSGLSKSGDKLVVKFADKDVVKLSGVVKGKSFTGLSASLMACGKSKKDGTTKYKLNVPVVEPTTKYYRLLTFKVTIDTATKKVTKVEKAFSVIE